ncbi:MAG: acyl-CoA dehydrogenase [Acidimicrobiia bacterium]|nr:acyl-CoA dehydrogenase [Acidimicrobiia bacterium]
MADVYAAPMRDLRFTLEHLVDTDALAKLPPFGHADVETMLGLLEEYGRFCTQELAPLNRVGDEQGAAHDPGTGAVTTPPGWKQAYGKYVAAGWNAVPFPEAHGGGGFPWLLAIAMQELLTSSNMAFSLCPLLTQGAIDMLMHHGTEEQQETYLRKMVTGEWTGTMNLTEPQAGSDVGALTTKAVPADDAGDGAYRITGQKIFITYGDQDLTDNIVHLVLARVPDAPVGTKGISCFIVPKFLSAKGGDPVLNGVRCIGIEHKMGIHGSPTCTMEYDGAVGWLVGGEPNRGMAQMFTMMNTARLSVGLEGLCLSERAYQAALSYAVERHQGRAPGRPAGTSSPIVDHPDVRRMLVHVRAHNEAIRALALTNAWAMDVAAHHPDADERSRADELADLLTPLTKGWSTDMGSELTRLATQVHGGMGYIRETGVEQHERDIRIAAIYEGTNGIQAMDLVGRKLPMRAGGVVADLLGRIEADTAALDGDLADVGAALSDGVAAAREATVWLLANGLAQPADAFAGAAPYLKLLSTVVAGWLMGRQAVAARPGAGTDPFLAAKVTTARYFCTQVVPGARGLIPAVTAGAAVLTDIPVAQLSGA